jgi:hypothetical protein
VELSVPLQNGFSLMIAGQSDGDGGVRPTGHAGGRVSGGGREDDGGYPTCRLQKGLLLRRGSADLAEEGVGFGVPILKRGIVTIFPGDVELAGRRDGAVWVITAEFQMNLVERLATPDGKSVKPASLYAAKNALAALHRSVPPLRGPLTATSNALRRRFGWVTTFEKAGATTSVRVTYRIDGEEGWIGVAVDTAGLPVDGVTDLVVMNEQGAHWFDRYVDAGGADLRGDQIGTWDRVTAEWAAFASTVHGVTFSLDQAAGARLYRGTELIGSRVAWSGFGYALPPTTARFRYDLRIDCIP